MKFSAEGAQCGCTFQLAISGTWEKLIGRILCNNQQTSIIIHPFILVLGNQAVFRDTLDILYTSTQHIAWVG